MSFDNLNQIKTQGLIEFAEEMEETARHLPLYHAGYYEEAASFAREFAEKLTIGPEVQREERQSLHE